MTNTPTPQTKTREELYRIVDGFLVESTNQKGEYRSIDRLNQDRHLAVERLEELLTRREQEAREEVAREIMDLMVGFAFRKYPPRDVLKEVSKYLNKTYLTPAEVGQE